MFEPLYTAEEMRAAEQGHDVDELMERAGRAVADEVLRRYPEARRVVGVCGGGANGGDGRIALRVLREAGLDAKEADDVEGADVVIDALFGTGFRGEPRPEAAAAIEQINASGAQVVSVDIPSGVDASTGEVEGDAVWADVTVTFHGRKVGLAVSPGRMHSNAVIVADIGLAPKETSHVNVTAGVLRTVPRREAWQNKYSAGSVLVVGGSPGLTGAACLAGRAAFRADAGYVAIAAPSESLPVLEACALEAVKRPLNEVFDALDRAGAVAVGPGLGAGHSDLVRRLLEDAPQLLSFVVDADGLRDLEPVHRAGHVVLTPHEGELARLIGEKSQWVQAHRLGALRRAVDHYNCVVLLKGADTLVSAPGHGTRVVGMGPPSLAVAGTGDVLTGVVASFLAKGMAAIDAAPAAAAAQQLAARHAPRYGMVATDVIEALPRVLAEHAPV